jgi:hypothetical protein
MAKLIIGILLFFAGILAVLLLLIIFLSTSLLAYRRRDKITGPATEKEGAG